MTQIRTSDGSGPAEFAAFFSRLGVPFRTIVDDQGRTDVRIDATAVEYLIAIARANGHDQEADDLQAMLDARIATEGDHR